MYEVSCNDCTSYVNNYFYCDVWPERLLYDAERDLLAIAEFVVDHSSVRLHATIV